MRKHDLQMDGVFWMESRGKKSSKRFSLCHCLIQCNRTLCACILNPSWASCTMATPPCGKCQESHSPPVWIKNWGYLVISSGCLGSPIKTSQCLSCQAVGWGKREKSEPQKNLKGTHQLMMFLTLQNQGSLDFSYLSSFLADIGSHLFKETEVFHVSRRTLPGLTMI